MARRVQDAAVAVHEVSAGSLSDPIRDADYVRAIDVHHVLLIAGPAITRALKDQTPSIVTEIGFGVFSAVCELSDVAEMRFSRLRRKNARIDGRLRRQRE
jgi:hypothetical protein